MTNIKGSTEIIAKSAEIIVKTLFPKFLLREGLNVRDFFDM